MYTNKEKKPRVKSVEVAVSQLIIPCLSEVHVATPFFATADAPLVLANRIPLDQ